MGHNVYKPMCKPTAGAKPRCSQMPPRESMYDIRYWYAWRTRTVCVTRASKRWQLRRMWRELSPVDKCIVAESEAEKLLVTAYLDSRKWATLAQVKWVQGATDCTAISMNQCLVTMHTNVTIALHSFNTRICVSNINTKLPLELNYVCTPGQIPWPLNSSL